MTMVLSGLWHGPYVGYYMTFITAALSIDLNRKVRALSPAQSQHRHSTDTAQAPFHPP